MKLPGWWTHWGTGRIKYPSSIELHRSSAFRTLSDLVLCVSSFGWLEFIFFIIKCNQKYTAFLNSVSHSNRLSHLRGSWEPPNLSPAVKSPDGLGHASPLKWGQSYGGLGSAGGSWDWNRICVPLMNESRVEFQAWVKGRVMFEEQASFMLHQIPQHVGFLLLFI